MHGIFAYGSNMHLGDLARWLDERGLAELAPLEARPARLVDHALDWHYHSMSRDGGAANVVPAPGAEVRGVVIHGCERLLEAIDAKEGHPVRYSRGTQPVPAACLHTGEVLEAWVYRVQPAYRTDAPVAPRAAYLQLMLEAAGHHGLGEDWQARLAAIATCD